jgi:hypothetical protein
MDPDETCASSMTDPRLFQQIATLVDRLRDLPPGDASNDVRERCLALIKHLEAQGLIPSGWDVSARLVNER